MSDANLRERLVVERLSIPPPSESRTSGQILSLKVGAWRLLPRILAVAGLLPDRGNVSFLDDDRCDCTVPVTLFRASAALCLPGSVTYTGAAFAFAVAVLRPGGDTILVRFEPIDEDTATHGAPHRIPARALNLTEKTIREFVLQWACRRPLWDRPAEESLPEFKAMVNGTKQCGR